MNLHDVRFVYVRSPQNDSLACLTLLHHCSCCRSFFRVLVAFDSCEVIELKGSPGSPTVGSAVARLLQGNPQLLEALQTLQWQFSMSAWSKTTVRIGNRTLFCRFSCQIHWYTQCFVMRLCLNKNRLFRDTSSCLFFCVTSCPQSGSQCKSFSSMPLSSKSAAVHPSDMELLQRRNKRQLNTNSHQQKRSWFLPFRKRTPQPHISPKCEQRKTSFF